MHASNCGPATMVTPDAWSCAGSAASTTIGTRKNLPILDQSSQAHHFAGNAAGTYDQGSHVQQFGSKKIDEEPVADYLGSLNTGMLLI